MPTPPKHRDWDDYYIPGTATLRNRMSIPESPYQTPYGFADYDSVERYTEAMSFMRLNQLHGDPIRGNFDRAHMEAIHGHLFQDVYNWAGQPRTAPAGPMVKKDRYGREHAYAAGDQKMVERLDQLYAGLAKDGYLQGLDQQTFPRALGAYWGHINVQHQFREGNTRSQFVFFTGLCDQAGYSLDSRAFAPGSPLREEFVEARFEVQDTGRTDRLAAVLSRGIQPKEHPGPSPSRMADWGREPRRSGLVERVSAELRSDPRSMFSVVAGQRAAQQAARSQRYDLPQVPSPQQSVDGPQL